MQAAVGLAPVAALTGARFQRRLQPHSSAAAILGRPTTLGRRRAQQSTIRPSAVAAPEAPKKPAAADKVRVGASGPVVRALGRAAAPQHTIGELLYSGALLGPDWCPPPPLLGRKILARRRRRR